MLKPVLDIAVPALVFLLMVVVGLGLTAADFRRVARQPRLMILATLGQFVCLPLIGFLLVRSFGLKPSVQQGVLLVAACPAGSLANLFTYLARANVALSVSLTAVSCLAAVLTMPILLVVFQASFGEGAAWSVPPLLIIRQLFLMLLLPIVVGMAIRRVWPAVSERHQRGLFIFSFAAVNILVGFVIVHELEHFADSAGEIARAVVVLTVLALLAGWLTGWAGGAGETERFSVAMVFVVRNVGVATAIAVTVLGQLEFAVFATGCFLSQVPLLLVGALLYRAIGAAVPGWRGAE